MTFAAAYAEPPNVQRTRWAAWLVAGFLVLASMAEVAWAGSVMVITGPDRNGLPPRDVQLRAMYAMRVREWPDGTPVKVFVLPDTDPLHAEFCRDLLGTYPYVMRTVWDRLVYTGTGVAPETVRSEAEMRSKVSSTKGAVGYVRTDNSNPESPTAPSVPTDKVKAVK